MTTPEQTETSMGLTHSHVPMLPSDVDVPSWARSARGPAWTTGQNLLGEFEVERVLGQGGMGIVYLVRQISTNKCLAAKRTHLLDPDSRRRFLGELQTWIDLPEHPHLVCCRFFRTIDDEVVVFTDFAEGGSLAERIRQGPLDTTFLFDAAIQMAWGLDSLHERGLVHQDVKPSNVLLSKEGRVQIADFGLARAWSRISQPEEADQSSTNLISGVAMTPAYCSPEQALHNPVTRSTDIWSWAVSVLEMFVGEVPSCAQGGPRALEVLEQFLATSSPRSNLLRSHPGLIELLRSCFQADVRQRPSDLGELANQLCALYATRAGRVYTRKAPSETDRPRPYRSEDSQTGLGMRWETPRVWMIRALRANGRNPVELDSIQPPLIVTRKGQAVADLTLYEEARELFESARANERAPVETDLALLHLHKALIHSALNDLPGAIASIDISIEAWLKLVHQHGKRELTGHLARAYLQKVRILRARGENREAVRVCNHIYQVWERMANRRRRRELREDLASAFVNKGLALRALGYPHEAVKLYDQALALWEEMVEQEKREELANDLAWTYLTKASVLSALGEGQESIRLCNRAIGIRRRLVQHDDTPATRADLARAHLHKANALRSTQNPEGALVVYDRTLDMFRRLVEKEGRDDLAPDLARVLLARAHAVRQRKQPLEAARWCGQAVSLLERLTHREGRQELMPDLARAYRHQSNMLRSAKENSEAYRLADLAVQVWHRLLVVETSASFQTDFARSLVSRGLCLWKMKSPRKALHDLDEALAVRQRMIADDEADDFAGFVGEMARDQIDRTEILLALHRRDEAKQTLTEAIQSLEQEIKRQERADFRWALRRGWEMLRRLGG